MNLSNGMYLRRISLDGQRSNVYVHMWELFHETNASAWNSLMNDRRRLDRSTTCDVQVCDRAADSPNKHLRFYCSVHTTTVTIYWATEKLMLHHFATSSKIVSSFKQKCQILCLQPLKCEDLVFLFVINKDFNIKHKWTSHLTLLPPLCFTHL